MGMPFTGVESQLMKREPGVGFAIANEIAATLDEELTPVNDRIKTMKLPLQKRFYATFINIHAPTMTNSEEVKEQFYSDLRYMINCLPADEIDTDW